MMPSFCAITTTTTTITAFSRITSTFLVLFFPLLLPHIIISPLVSGQDMIFKSSPAILKISSGPGNGSSSSFSSSSSPTPQAAPLARSQMSASQCPAELGGRCTCGIGPYRSAQNGGRPTYITNCTGAGFGKTPLSPAHYLQAVDNRTEVLIFTGNHFPELPANLLLLNRRYLPLLSTIVLT